MGKNKQVIGLMKGELGRQIMKKLTGLRAKNILPFKETKKGVIKKNLKFRDYRKCLKPSQIENIINYLEKKEIDADNLKEITKYKRVILKTQQRFKSERHNVFTEEINTIALSSNDDKRMQSIHSIETYAHG